MYLFLPQSNPFRRRICSVFSTSEHKDGSLTFEDFLDLLSAFSDSATLEIKSHYAFRIFGKYLIKRAVLIVHIRISVCVIRILMFSDFDDDGTLDCGDLEKLVNCLTGETDDTRLTTEEMRQLISNVSSLRLLLFSEDVGRHTRWLKQPVVAGWPWV